MDQSTLTNILLTIPVLLFALVAHEWAHAFAALKQGDPTALDAGRLTFNPIKHIDPWMTIIIPGLMLYASHGTAAFGGAKPCPVNPANFKSYKRSDIIVSLAGVTMNMLIALISTLLFLCAGLIGQALPASVGVMSIVQQMMGQSVWMNVILVFFNLLPFPPLDGSHVVKHFLPPVLAVPYARFARFGLVILMLVCFYAGNVINVLLTPAIFVSRILMHPVLPFALASL